MSLSAGAVIGIITLITSLTTGGIKAGKEGAASREQEAEDQETLDRQQAQAKEVEGQEDRRANIKSLSRQSQRRQGAGVAARETIQKPSVTSGLPESTQAIGRAPQAPPSPAAPTTTPSTFGSDIVSGATQIAGDVASTAFAAKAAGAQQTANEQSQEQIAQLQEDEFKRIMAKSKRNIDTEALDFQDLALAGPALSARKKSFANQDLFGAIKNMRKAA